ncbi:YsnF/AvaK domain-containing protein [Arenibaculum pallidiluteum]|uniref:YsnF/AvaK domain-containing protein n=1 Tax=Arenibaculum pallidiluteum TaxID=2812559 RepID=UPI001A977E15|nr:YsnF/AvaK domain-containing protein [Arenibaculum pallidiluteum]
MLTMVTCFRDRDTIGQVRERLAQEGVALTDAEVFTASDASVEERLTARNVPSDDARTYRQALAGGNALLVGSVAEADLDRAEAIMDDYGPVNVEEGLSAAAGQLRDVDAGLTDGTATTRTVADGGIAGSARADTVRGEGEEVIPIVEEELRVGKRAVERGGVRVRSYVVETPVTESVALRNETVSVERRAVDLPAGEIPADAFRERTIEVTETDEEAVVSKDARVREELVIRKDVEERAQTVSDTVRRTEVEVEDDRTEGVARTRVDRTDV